VEEEAFGVTLTPKWKLRISVPYCCSSMATSGSL